MISTIDQNIGQTDYLPDVKEIVMTIWRHRATLISVVMGLALIGSPLILFKSTKYVASSTVMIQEGTVNLKDFEQVAGSPKFDNMTVQTEVKVLNSPTLALKTIEALKLNETDEFESPSGDPKQSIGRFLNNLSVTQQGVTRVIQVSFKSEDPDLAAKVVNAHVANYLQSQITDKTTRVDELSTWFEDRVKKLKTDVVTKSRAASDFRVQNKLIVGKNDEELIYQYINDTSAKISAAQTSKVDTESKLSAIEAIKGTPQPDAIATIVSSPIIQRLKNEVSDASQELAELRGKYGPHHPLVVAAGSKLGQATSSLNKEAANIKETLRNDITAAEKEINLLSLHLESLEKQANEQRAKMITYNSLRVEEETSQKLLDSFLANYERIQSQDNLPRSDASVISPAVTSGSPSGPGKIILLFILVIAAGCIGLATIFVMEVMSSGINNFDDIRKYQFKPMGILPQVANPVAIAGGNHNSGYKEALKRVYMSGLIDNKVKSLLVTSALPKEGRTTFVLSMAQYMRSIGHDVVVIDADFLNPTISFSEGEVRAPGLSDYFAGQSPLSSIITTNSNGISFIKSGSHALPSPDVLRAKQFDDLMIDLKNRFNFILFDSSPLLAHSESEIIAGRVDGVIIVAEWMKTSHTNMSNVAVTLRQANANVIGAVLNKVDIEKYKIFTSGSDFLLPNMTRADFS